MEMEAFSKELIKRAQALAQALALALLAQALRADAIRYGTLESVLFFQPQKI